MQFEGTSQNSMWSKILQLTHNLLYDYWLSLPDYQSKWKGGPQMWGGEEGRFGSPFQFFSQNASDWKGNLALALPPSLLVSSLPVDRAAFPSASVNNSSGCLSGWRKFLEMQEILELVQITIGSKQQTRILVGEEYLDTLSFNTHSGVPWTLNSSIDNADSISVKPRQLWIEIQIYF